MLKRIASAVERIEMALFGHPSQSPNPSQSQSRSRPSPSPNPSQSQSRSRPSPSPSPSRSRPSPNPLSRTLIRCQLRRSPSPKLRPSPSHPSPCQSPRGWLLPVGECTLGSAPQDRRLSLLRLARRRHRLDPRPGPRPNSQPHNRLLQLAPVRRSHARASRFRHPPAARQRPLRARRFRRPPAGEGGVRHRVPEGALVVLPDQRAVPAGRVSPRRGGHLRH